MTHGGERGAAFSDVPSGDSYANAVYYLRDEGIITGYSDGTFRPDQTINRAEFTKIVTGAQFNAAADIAMCQTASFPDVRKTDWFAPYVCVAKTKNIVAGYPDGTFRPGHNISFAEAAKILVRVFVGDVQSDDVWYKPYVETLETLSAIPTTITRFDQSITRGEMAEMIYRLKMGITSEPSQTYKSLEDNNAPADMSQEKIYRYEGTTLNFRLPAEWPHEKQRGPNPSDGGLPYASSLWSLNLGPICKGCAEGEDTYSFTIDAYTPDANLIKTLYDDSLVDIESDVVLENGTRRIVYTEAGICGGKKAFFFTGTIDYKFDGMCAADSRVSEATFDNILATIVVQEE